MRWVIIISAIFYALLIISLFTVFSSLISQNMKIIIIALAPMVIGGLCLVILKIAKGNGE